MRRAAAAVDGDVLIAFTFAAGRRSSSTLLLAASSDACARCAASCRFTSKNTHHARQNLLPSLILKRCTKETFYSIWGTIWGQFLNVLFDPRSHPRFSDSLFFEWSVYFLKETHILLHPFPFSLTQGSVDLVSKLSKHNT